MNIKLNNEESAVWREVGSRGDVFRRATRDRAAEQVRTQGRMSEILDSRGVMVDALAPGDPDPESIPTSAASEGPTPRNEALSWDA